MKSDTIKQLVECAKELFDLDDPKLTSPEAQALASQLMRGVTTECKRSQNLAVAIAHHVELQGVDLSSGNLPDYTGFKDFIEGVKTNMSEGQLHTLGVISRNLFSQINKAPE